MEPLALSQYQIAYNTAWYAIATLLAGFAILRGTRRVKTGVIKIK